MVDTLIFIAEDLNAVYWHLISSHSLNGRSLEITLTVPLSCNLIFLVNLYILSF